jgi:hypothetical protein
MSMINIALTMELQIKKAMKKIGLSERANEFLDVLDEIELDISLKISMKQADRGEARPIEEFEKAMKEKFANGYFSKEAIQKREEDIAAKPMNIAAIKSKVKKAMKKIGLGERSSEFLDTLYEIEEDRRRKIRERVLRGKKG